MTEKIHHPAHYNEHPSGVEAIDLCEHLGFNVGNAVKYLFRAGKKPGAEADEDLKKARWYLVRAWTMPDSMQADLLIGKVCRDLMLKVQLADPHSVLGRVLCDCLVLYDYDDEGDDVSVVDYKHAMLQAFDIATEGRFA